MNGINDIGREASLNVEDLIAGHKQLIERAHARGLTIYAGTLTPVDTTTGNFVPYSTPENQAKRLKINEWIRTSQAYDGVIDFDAALRDPSNPKKVQAQWLSADNLHPNDTGYQAMAAAIDLTLLKTGRAPARTATK